VKKHLNIKRGGGGHESREKSKTLPGVGPPPSHANFLYGARHLGPFAEDACRGRGTEGLEVLEGRGEWKDLSLGHTRSLQRGGDWKTPSVPKDRSRRIASLGGENVKRGALGSWAPASERRLGGGLLGGLSKSREGANSSSQRLAERRGVYRSEAPEVLRSKTPTSPQMDPRRGGWEKKAMKDSKAQKLGRETPKFRRRRGEE